MPEKNKKIIKKKICQKLKKMLIKENFYRLNLNKKMKLLNIYEKNYYYKIENLKIIEYNLKTYEKYYINYDNFLNIYIELIENENLNYLNKILNENYKLKDIDLKKFKLID